MPNIKANITKLVEKIVIEDAANPGKSPTAQMAHDLAVRAIVVGQGMPPGAITQQWRDYMTFLLSESGAAADPNDLRRLLPEDGTHTNADMQEERAYLVGNGVCGTTTTDGLIEGEIRGTELTTFIDQP